MLAQSFPWVFPYLHFLTLGRHRHFHLSGDVLDTTVFGQFFFLNSVAKSWLLDFRGYCLKESWTQVVSCTKKKTGVEFLTGIHNLGYLPHELLSPECNDCCSCVVDGLSPSGFEVGGLMWRLPVWSKVSNNFRWNAVRLRSDVTWFREVEDKLQFVYSMAAKASTKRGLLPGYFES